MEVRRRKWYSAFVRVCEGATTMLSPVCMPRGSKFSILQTAMQLSQLSLTISYSISFHPFRDFSMSTWPEKVKAFAVTASSSVSSSQKPDPRPPRAYAARTITGYPSSAAAFLASSCEAAACERIVCTPISSRRCTNNSRSSVSMMVCTGVPSTRTPAYLIQTLHEQLAVFGVDDGLHGSTQHADAVMLEHAAAV